MRAKIEGIGSLLGLIYYAAAGIFDLYLIYIFYAGGRIPGLDLHVRGGFLTGTLWMFAGNAMYFFVVAIPAVVVALVYGKLTEAA